MTYFSNRWTANEKKIEPIRPFNLVLLLATRCIYWGVHLTEDQPDPKNNQKSWWPYVVLLLATRCLYQGVCLSKICLTVICLLNWALENCTGHVYRLIFLFLVLLLLLCNFIVVDHLSLCIHNYSWKTTKLHSNNNNNTKINVHKLLNLFVLIAVVVTVSCCCCLYVIVHWQLQMNNNNKIKQKQQQQKDKCT